MKILLGEPILIQSKPKLPRALVYYIKQDSTQQKSAILILRKKMLKTSKRLLLLSNILLVRQISYFLLTKNVPKHIFA